MDITKLTLRELSVLAGISERTIRLYIQKELLARPVDQKKAAYYTPDHLRQLLEIARLKRAGVTLAAIKEIMAGAENGLEIACRPKKPGDIRVCSRVWLAPGLELHVDPQEFEFDDKQVCRLISVVLNGLESIRAGRRAEESTAL